MPAFSKHDDRRHAVRSIHPGSGIHSRGARFAFACHDGGSGSEQDARVPDAALLLVLVAALAAALLAVAARGPIRRIRAFAAHDATPVLFFDGVCGFCNRSVDYVIRRDTSRVFRFAPLQSATAERTLSAHGIDASRLESVVVTRDDIVLTRTDAVLATLLTIGWPSWLVYAIAAIPIWLRDPGYAVIGHFRYRIFGKRDACRIPTPEERAVFLSDEPA